METFPKNSFSLYYFISKSSFFFRNLQEHCLFLLRDKKVNQTYRELHVFVGKRGQNRKYTATVGKLADAHGRRGTCKRGLPLLDGLVCQHCHFAVSHATSREKSSVSLFPDIPDGIDKSTASAFARHLGLVP